MVGAMESAPPSAVQITLWYAFVPPVCLAAVPLRTHHGRGRLVRNPQGRVGRRGLTPVALLRSVATLAPVLSFNVVIRASHLPAQALSRFPSP